MTGGSQNRNRKPGTHKVHDSNHPGTPRAIGNTWCTRHMAKPRPQVGRVCLSHHQNTPQFTTTKCDWSLDLSKKKKLTGHLTHVASLAAKRRRKCWPSQWTATSVEHTNGVKSARQSAHACLCLIFFAVVADSRTEWTGRLTYDEASVLTTLTSNSTSVWGSHIPLTARSQTII